MRSDELSIPHTSGKHKVQYEVGGSCHVLDRRSGLTATSCELKPTTVRVLSFSGRIDRRRIEDAEEALLRSATTLARLEEVIVNFEMP
jgi:hypothetical protein